METDRVEEGMIMGKQVVQGERMAATRETLKDLLEAMGPADSVQVLVSPRIMRQYEQVLVTRREEATR